MPSEPTLEHLVNGSVAGDAESFRALAAKLDAKLLGYVRSRVATRDEALDLAADILVDVWKALRSFRYESDPAFYRFVYTIARRHLYRSWQRPRPLPLGEAEGLAADERPEDAIAVSSAVERLPRTAREIVVLRHWSGFSFKEIGDQLGMNQTAVRVRHHRALTSLRSLLAAHA